MKLTCLIVSTLLIVFISQQSTNALPIDDLTTQHSCLEGFELINGECHPVLSSTQESVTESNPSEFAKVTLSYEVTTVENKKLGESEDCPKGKVLSKTGVCEDIIFEDQLSTTPKSKKLKETPEEHDNEPLDHTTEAVESEHKPKVLTDKPVEHDNEPLDHTTEPVEGEHKPVEHEKELLDHTTEPVEDEHKPVDDEDKPIEDEHKPKPKPKMHKGGPVEDELHPHPHPHPHPHKDGPMEDEREPKPKVHKVRPVEDEPKPIDHEDKPVEDERKPKPKIHKVRPIEDEPKPKPIDHEDKPVEDERKPKPIDHEDKPVEDERKPKPKIHKVRPIEDEPKPKPINHEDKPVEDENEPSAVNEEKSDVPKGCPSGTKFDEQGACQDEIEHSTTTLKMNLKDLLPKDGSCPPGMELFKEKCIYIKSKDNSTMDDSTNIEENKSDKVVLEDKLVSMLKGGVCPPDTEYYSNGLCRIRTSPSSSNILIVKEKCQAGEILIDGKCQRKEVELIKTSSISPKTKSSNEDEDKPVESL